MVRRAAERGQTVRPVGAGHSFSALAVTDGVHVDLSAFTGLTGIGGRPGHATVRVRAGTTLGELQDELAARDLALAAPLELTAPTVGGALAVGMHGSGAELGSLSVAVAGLRLVDGRGRVRDVPADELDAARTSLGALGIVLDAELRVVPAGRVRVTRAPRPVDEVLSTRSSGRATTSPRPRSSRPPRPRSRAGPTRCPGPPDSGAETDEAARRPRSAERRLG